MVYGYTRVSSKDQCLDRQYQALANYKHIDRVFSDKQSGKDFDREQYQAMKQVASRGDEIVIEELDRLGRNKSEMKAELEWFRQNGITIRILEVPTTLIEIPGQEWVKDMVNNVIIEVLGSVAEQERIKTRKRQREGIDAMCVVEGKRISSKTNRSYGRPQIETSDFRKFLQKQKDGEITVDEAIAQLGISRSTWYARVREMAV